MTRGVDPADVDHAVAGTSWPVRRIRDISRPRSGRTSYTQPRPGASAAIDRPAPVPHSGRGTEPARRRRMGRHVGGSVVDPAVGAARGLRVLDVGHTRGIQVIDIASLLRHRASDCRDTREREPTTPSCEAEACEAGSRTCDASRGDSAVNESSIAKWQSNRAIVASSMMIHVGGGSVASATPTSASSTGHLGTQLRLRKINQWQHVMSFEPI